MSAKPDLDCVGMYPTLPVGDLLETVEWYQDKLGFDLRFLYGDPPVHGAVILGRATIHFYPGTPNTDGHWIYLQVEDIDETFEWIAGNGVTFLDEPTDQPWQMREFSLRDPNGYVLRFGAAIITAGDPVPIERFEFTVPIEKRLHKLLIDLARHKRMTLSEMLEETLLHSFETEPEVAGKWTASPHTARNLRHVKKLKDKHGIDYDTHDSYRFQEKDK